MVGGGAPERGRARIAARLISLPWDEEGRPIIPIIPMSRVTALVETMEAWATEPGSLDAVTRWITRGKLVMPRAAATSQQTALRNHPSWEKNEDAKRAPASASPSGLRRPYFSTYHGAQPSLRGVRRANATTYRGAHSAQLSPSGLRRVYASTCRAAQSSPSGSGLRRAQRDVPHRAVHHGNVSYLAVT